MEDPTIAVIGLGYVGLPLAVEFSPHFTTIGFDIGAARIDELCAPATTARWRFQTRDLPPPIG